ncbi:DUF4172 domain-containing protein [Thiolapillus sp.]
MWIWQNKDWPNFKFDASYLLARIAHRSPGSGVFGRRDVAKIDR